MPAGIRWFIAVALWGVLAAAPKSVVKRLDGARLPAKEIDETVLRLMRAAEVPGVGITIFNHGKVAYSKAYGFRDVAKQLPLTEDTVMGGASLSKAVFAWLVMQMVANGVLDLDVPVQNYLPSPLPEYPAYQDLSIDPRYQKITARMLLSHTSGLPNIRYLNPDRRLNIHFEPGSRYAYSGEGIQLLQFVIESLMGRPLHSLMQERVFDPLRMTRTSMITMDRFADNCATGYDEWGRPLQQPVWRTAAAAGSMQTTQRDFTRFLRTVIRGQKLAKSARKEMLSPQVRIFSRRQFPTLDAATTSENQAIRLSYGLGWGLFWTPRGKAYFKEGHAEGFRHYAVVFDQSQDGIVILTNSSNGEGIFKELLESLLGDTFTPIAWEGFTPYNELPPRKPLPKHTGIAVAPALLDRLVGRYAVPGAVLRVTRQGARLLLQENEGEPGELFPEAELRFFSKTSDDVITFELDGNGKAVRLVIHAGGQTIPVNRSEIEP